MKRTELMGKEALSSTRLTKEEIAKLTPEELKNVLLQYACRQLKEHGKGSGAHLSYLDQAKKYASILSRSDWDDIWQEALKLSEDHAGGQAFSDLQKKEEQQPRTLKPTDYSDVGQAEVLANAYGKILRYTDATDYIVYKGNYWAESRVCAKGIAQKLTARQLAEARQEIKECQEKLIEADVSRDVVLNGSKSDIKKEAESSKQQELLKRYDGACEYRAFVVRRREDRYLNSTLEAAKPKLLTDTVYLDRNPYLLNTPVATFDLRKGLEGARPHDPDDFITKITACSPGATGKDIFDRALSQTFNDDQGIIDYFQCIIGQAAFGQVKAENLVIAYGDGANGKSTIFNAIAKTLGSYSGKIPSAALMNTDHNMLPHIAELRGKRMVIASESDEKASLSAMRVKAMCSTDDIVGEKKYRAPISFTPEHMLILYTNHLPSFDALDDGLLRRLIILPFTAHFTGDADVKDYADYLFTHAGPAIMAWIIEGARKVWELDFHTERIMPNNVREAIQQYRDKNDWFRAFLNECCDVGSGYVEKSGSLYKYYLAHCRDYGQPPHSTARFYEALAKAGFERRRGSEGWKVFGLRLQQSRQDAHN